MTDIVSIARDWIQTPYQHQMSLKGVGCDCIGLVRGVWRTLYGDEPWTVPPYSPDWAEVEDEPLLLEALGRNLTPVNAAQVGDVISFQMRANVPAKHVAILSAGEGLDDPKAKIIHAYWGRAVVESWLRPYWRTHAVAAFRFP